MAATLFDFDGVLVDSEPVHLEAFRDVVRPLGITITQEDYVRRYLGLDDYGAFREILARAKHTVSRERLRQLVDQKNPAFMKRFSESLRVFDGAVELVRRRAKLGPVAVVSGALEREVQFGLEKMGIIDDVLFVVSAEACKACKPDPEGYLLAMRSLEARGKPTAGAVVVEDSVAGVQAGKSAGLRVVAVAHSYPAEDLAKAGADAIASTIADITDAMLDGT